MTLFAYRTFLQRWWWLIVSPAILACGLAAANTGWPSATYRYSVRYIVGVPPLPSDLDDNQEDLRNWFTSEYVAAAVHDWVGGVNFAEQVTAELQAAGDSDITVDDVWGRFSGDYTRSVVSVNVEHTDEDELLRYIGAANQLITTRPESVTNFPALADYSAEFARADAIDAFGIQTINPTWRDFLPYVFFTGAGLLAGLMVALALDYTDRSVRSRYEVMQLQMTVLGEIPKVST